jgi:hypothetical protein
MVQMKGELATSYSSNVVAEIEIPLSTSRMMFVNPMPVEIRIGDIVVDASNSGSTKLSWWTGSGYETASWMDAWDVGESDEDIDLGYDTWVDPGSQIPVTNSFAIGEGFFIDGPVSGNSVFFPNPLGE